jgi:hypothetical protein
VDKQLVPGFSYIFFFVITQITFGFYVTVVVALGILGLRFLVNHPEILLPPLLTALGKKVGDTVLHYCLTVDGIIQRPRCWLLLDPSWGLLSILGSTPSALVRFAIAIVEGVLRSTQMHRPSASGLLASLDPGFGAYMCVPPLLKAARRLPFFPPSLPCCPLTLYCTAHPPPPSVWPAMQQQQLRTLPPASPCTSPAPL